MKKIFTLFLLTCSIGFMKANPIAPPPVISEFYLVDSSHWYLELVFLPPYNFTTLNGFKIVTSSGTFYLKNGIHIIQDSIIVITQDSLQTLLQINRNGDFIKILDSAMTGNGYPMDQLYFGNISGSQISAPKQGQSIVKYGYTCAYSMTPTVIYCFVKDNHPTIGFNAFKPFNAIGTTTRGTFSGIVYDYVHQPVKGIHVGNVYYTIPCGVSACQTYFCSALTDSTGKFSLPEYSGRYGVDVFFKYSRIFVSTTVNIESDSINYYEFTIDTTLTGVNTYSLQKKIDLICSPNPSTGETTISFGMPAGRHYTKALIKIYNSNGEMVRILPVSINSSQIQYAVKWDGLCSDNSAASGIYFCNLELDGQKVASNKII